MFQKRPNEQPEIGQPSKKQRISHYSKENRPALAETAENRDSGVNNDRTYKKENIDGRCCPPLLPPTQTPPTPDTPTLEIPQPRHPHPLTKSETQGSMMAHTKRRTLMVGAPLPPLHSPPPPNQNRNIGVRDCNWKKENIDGRRCPYQCDRMLLSSVSVKLYKNNPAPADVWCRYHISTCMVDKQHFIQQSIGLLSHFFFLILLQNSIQKIQDIENI